jgi:hypothetical protein
MGGGQQPARVRHAAEYGSDGSTGLAVGSMIIFCPSNATSEAPRLEGGDLQPLEQHAEEGAVSRRCGPQRLKPVIQGSAYRGGEPLRHPKEKAHGLLRGHGSCLAANK